MIQSARRKERAKRTVAQRARAFAAIFVILPLLLQLAAAAAPMALAKSVDALSASAMQNCEADGHRDTSGGRGDHSHCCLLCEWNARDGLAIVDSFVVADIDSDRPARPIRPASERPKHPPIGWTTSWSSRAPPLFS